MNRDFAKARLAVLMGGRVAEEITFGQFTTGASNDIKQASNLARRMVTEFGMSDKIGPIHFGSDEESVFLGKEFSSSRRTYSESVAQLIDDEIKHFVLEGHEVAKQLLSEHRDTLDKLAQALLDRETLDAEDVDAVVGGRELPNKERVVIPSYSDRERAAKEKRRAASIFGAPKPAPSA
jgi:cell division protease FtsH